MRSRGRCTSTDTASRFLPSIDSWVISSMSPSRRSTSLAGSPLSLIAHFSPMPYRVGLSSPLRMTSRASACTLPTTPVSWMTRWAVTLTTRVSWARVALSPGLRSAGLSTWSLISRRPLIVISHSGAKGSSISCGFSSVPTLIVSFCSFFGLVDFHFANLALERPPRRSTDSSVASRPVSLPQVVYDDAVAGLQVGD